MLNELLDIEKEILLIKFDRIMILSDENPWREKLYGYNYLLDKLIDWKFSEKHANILNTLMILKTKTTVRNQKLEIAKKYLVNHIQFQAYYYFHYYEMIDMLGELDDIFKYEKSLKMLNIKLNKFEKLHPNDLVIVDSKKGLYYDIKR